MLTVESELDRLFGTKTTQASGRIRNIQPSFQQMPIRTPDGSRIREAFKPEVPETVKNIEQLEKAFHRDHIQK